MTRFSVPLFSSTISSAMRRSVRSNARASSTVCGFAAAMVRPICDNRAANGSEARAGRCRSAERRAQCRLAVLGRLHARERIPHRFAAQQPSDDALNDGEALAATAFQSRPVDHLDAPAAHLDEAALLEQAERLG